MNYKWASLAADGQVGTNISKYLVAPKYGLCHQPAQEARAVLLESRIPLNGGTGGMEWAKEFQPPTQTIIEEALEDYFTGNSPQFYTADYKLEIMSSTITTYTKQISQILFSLGT